MSYSYFVIGLSSEPRIIALGDCGRKFLVIFLPLGQGNSDWVRQEMAIEHSENWFLRKHDNGEVFGPVPFEKIREWADSAQVNPQDMLSIDEVIWTKAPMIPEMEMDWLIVMGENLLYGPTTAEALLEFEKLGEINPSTALINCNTGQSSTLRETPFYQASLGDPMRREQAPASAALASIQQPGQSGSLRVNLQQRIRELENTLLDKSRKLKVAEESIVRLETKIRELEDRIRDYSGFRRS